MMPVFTVCLGILKALELGVFCDGSLSFFLCLPSAMASSVEKEKLLCGAESGGEISTSAVL